MATDDPDTNVDIGKVGHLIPKMQPDTTARQRPDEIAHTLVTNVGESIRVYLEDGRITVPVEPCRGGTPVTTTVALDCFDAVVERAAIEDGGLNLFCMDGLHLPESEWRRSGLERHWCADDADLESPFFPPQRRLEVWASREDALFDAGEPYDFSHLDGLPEDSPVLTEWAEHATGEYPDRPPVPFERPTLSVDTVRAEGVTDVRGFDRVEVGRISRVELLDEIDEAPTEPDVEPREVDGCRCDSRPVTNWVCSAFVHDQIQQVTVRTNRRRRSLERSVLRCGRPPVRPWTPRRSRLEEIVL